MRRGFSARSRYPISRYSQPRLKWAWANPGLRETAWFKAMPTGPPPAAGRSNEGGGRGGLPGGWVRGQRRPPQRLGVEQVQGGLVALDRPRRDGLPKRVPPGPPLGVPVGSRPRGFFVVGG